MIADTHNVDSTNAQEEAPGQLRSKGDIKEQNVEVKNRTFVMDTRRTNRINPNRIGDKVVKNFLSRKHLGNLCNVILTTMSLDARKLLDDIPIEVLADAITVNMMKPTDNLATRIDLRPDHKDDAWSYLSERLKNHFLHCNETIEKKDIISVTLQRFSNLSSSRNTQAWFPKNATRAYVFSLNYSFQLLIRNIFKNAHGQRIFLKKPFIKTVFSGKFPHIDLSQCSAYGVMKTKDKKGGVTYQRNDDILVCTIYTSTH
uniref:Uncharacterized protein n=1 Tax=Pithovirus LCDPAC01 TaxID=2506600 RepID=A0A481YMT6_9VIRU|nr:MAG: hypothetical protein LCDPAC01_01510 [Pithovirus LCDPAC01]